MISNDFKWSSTIIDYPSTCPMSTSVIPPIVDAIRSISVLIKYQHQHKQWNELTIVLFPFGISYTINIFQDRISVTNTHRRKLIFCWCWRSKRSRATSNRSLSTPSCGHNLLMLSPILGTTWAHASRNKNPKTQSYVTEIVIGKQNTQTSCNIVLLKIHLTVGSLIDKA